VLRDVVCWLELNAMGTENTQQSLLYEQTLANVWRKAAFRRLATQHAQVEGGRVRYSVVREHAQVE
jgi:hypothetical protein